ncbi:MAG: UDP-galactopyranose mutase [Candidatus Kapaibacterium sp.]
MKFDYLIVGSGYTGCVLAERISNLLDKKVLLVEKRNHIGGNSYDHYDEQGILVHKYGPHIFHTMSKKVWDYLSGFTAWKQYYHHVLAMIEGKKVPVPFNLNSIYNLFPPNYAGKLEDLLTGTYGYGIKIPILKLKETKNPELKFLADYIYKNVFYGYTLKQWGLKPEELDYTVTSRVPVYISRDDRYFQDPYQGIPANGYTAMFKKMISHKNIHLLLNTDYKDIIEDIKFDKMIYSGHIDYFFDEMFGRLPYRSLEFDFKTYNTEQYQQVAQVNYPNDHNYTRITEFKHFSGQQHPRTSVAYEYPVEYEKGKNDPYYPVPNQENHDAFAKYRKEADKLEGSVYFTGRLADYKYYNMDQTVAVALMLFEKKIAES